MKKSERIAARGAFLSGVGACLTGLAAVIAVLVTSGSKATSAHECHLPVIVIDRPARNLELPLVVPIAEHRKDVRGGSDRSDVGETRVGD